MDIVVSVLVSPTDQMTLESSVSPFTESNCRGYPVLISMESKRGPLLDGSVAVHDPEGGTGVGVGVDVGPGAGVGVAVVAIVGCGVTGRPGITSKIKAPVEPLSVSIDNIYSLDVAGVRNNFALN